MLNYFVFICNYNVAADITVLHHCKYLGKVTSSFLKDINFSVVTVEVVESRQS